MGKMSSRPYSYPKDCHYNIVNHILTSHKPYSLSKYLTYDRLSSLHKVYDPHNTNLDSTMSQSNIRNGKML